jgi:hypothetical protein
MGSTCLLERVLRTGPMGRNKAGDGQGSVILSTGPLSGVRRRSHCPKKVAFQSAPSSTVADP